jgi:hypothetical protein
MRARRDHASSSRHRHQGDDRAAVIPQWLANVFTNKEYDLTIISHMDRSIPTSIRG